MTTLADGVDEIKQKLDKELVLNGHTETKVNGSVDRDAPPSWLDEAFVERVLRRDAGNDALTVASIAVRRAVPVGDNYASVLQRVSVEYRDDADGQPRHTTLIVKSVPDTEMMRKWIDEVGLFASETRMYEVTLPAIYRLLQERTGKTPEPLATRVYAHDHPEAIVLADLKPLGYKMADRREGLDFKHSVMALRALAKLHGLSVALHAQDPTSMDNYAEKMFTEATRKMQGDMMTSIFGNLATEVKSWPGFERFEEKLLKMSHGFVGVDKVIELVKNKPGRMRVLNHGDFWTNNMLFRYDADGNVEDVKMLDFQIVRFASPAIDLIYFLHTSPSQQVLEDRQKELLDEYHTALCDTMRLAGCAQDLFITRDQLDQEMQDKAYFAVMISCMSSIMLAEPEDAPDFSSITEEDMENGSVDAMNKAFAGKRFKVSFQRRLPKFESEGLI